MIVKNPLFTIFTIQYCILAAGDPKADICTTDSVFDACPRVIDWVALCERKRLRTFVYTMNNQFKLILIFLDFSSPLHPITLYCFMVCVTYCKHFSTSHVAYVVNRDQMQRFGHCIQSLPYNTHDSR